MRASTISDGPDVELTKVAAVHIQEQMLLALPCLKTNIQHNFAFPYFAAQCVSLSPLSVKPFYFPDKSCSSNFRTNVACHVLTKNASITFSPGKKQLRKLLVSSERSGLKIPFFLISGTTGGSSTGFNGFTQAWLRG